MRFRSLSAGRVHLQIGTIALVPPVPAPQQHEYFLLQYAPNALSERCVNVGLVLWTPASPSGFCTARFAPTWRMRVHSLDPRADIEMLAALFEDIERRLGNPDLRQEMLRMIQDSFSNAIRVSEKQRCILQDPNLEVEAIAARYL
jgi:hypothetical protein